MASSAAWLLPLWRRRLQPWFPAIFTGVVKGNVCFVGGSQSFRPLSPAAGRLLDAACVPRSFSSSAASPPLNNAQGPSVVDYRSLLHEDEFHRLADETIHHLQEKFEEFGDMIQIDGFDVDYGNHVLTLKLGSLGTYVINKQTPNRQIWLSSPVSGPSRFDWDGSCGAWLYRRNKANLSQLLEDELGKLSGKSIQLS